jgi:hypothetical protein
MPVDEAKQVYGWWTNVDVDIHCFCGWYLGVYDDGPLQVICSNCGQHWYAHLIVYPQEPDIENA